MGDNDLRTQAQQAVAQIAAARKEQQQNTKPDLRPSVPSTYGLNGTTNLRDSMSLNEGVDFENGVNFAENNGDTL